MRKPGTRFAGRWVVAGMILAGATISRGAEEKPLLCEQDPRYREFDFWIGDWDVFDPKGKKVGPNRVEKVTNGCTLLENWTGAGGSIGKSINYFDPDSEEWVQIWVDGSGGNITTRGKLRDGAMVLEGKHVHNGGRIELYRGTWIPLEDGKVHQYLEQSKDEGKTWYVWFDGTYVRRKTGQTRSGSP